MKILVVIPARYASTRLPGKPMADICGKPMIQWVYEAVKACDAFDEVIVATDDERILNCVKGFGGKAEMTSESHSNGTLRCAEVADRHREYDYVINVQGDEPLIDPADLSAFASVLGPDIQIASVCRPLHPSEDPAEPSLVKVACAANMEALYFSRSPIPFNRSGSASYLAHIGIYAFQRDLLMEVCKLAPGKLEEAESLEQLRWLENGYRIKLCPWKEQSPAVDTPEGLEQVRKLMALKLGKA